MRILDLSHTIVSDMLRWPGDERATRIIRVSDHGTDNHRSSALELGCHVGTHIDAPLHFRAGEPALPEIPVERFAGRARVIRADERATPGPLPATLLDGVDLSGLDYLLFDTGWDRHWGTERYYEEWPWFGEELVRKLASSGLKGSGLDTPSLDPFDGTLAHDLCAAVDMVNVENLTGLDALPDDFFTLLVLPLKLADAEASPVRAVALLDDRDRDGRS